MAHCSTREMSRTCGGSILKPRSHMHCNLSATAMWPENNCMQCNHLTNRHFLVANQSTIDGRSIADQRTGLQKLSIKIGDQSGNGWWLVGDGLATGWGEGGGEGEGEGERKGEGRFVLFRSFSFRSILPRPHCVNNVKMWQAPNVVWITQHSG